jgi:glycosyltransferase involved in cell wall biosynthesis
MVKGGGVKRILFVSQLVPERTSGGGFATLGMLHALRCGGWHVHLLLNCQEEELPRVNAARAHCDELTWVRRPRMRFTPRVPGISCLLRFGYWPRWQREVWGELHALLRARPFDAIFLDWLGVAEYGRLCKEHGFRQPIVLREHNVEHELQAQLAPLRSHPIRRLETMLRTHRYRAIEANLARYCDVALPITDVDAAKLAALNPGFPVETMPHPLDTDHFRPSGPGSTGKEMVFVGGMRWAPNHDAVRWFVEEILPAVLARHPDAHLTVVGADPPAWLARHAPHVTAVGFVPDEREFVAKARVFVAPIRHGSGVRIKILNALAMAKAVVSTRIGAEGIRVEHRRSIFLADRPEEFADAVGTLLDDERRAVTLGENALRVCLEQHAPARVADRLSAAILGEAARRRSA